MNDVSHRDFDSTHSHHLCFDRSGTPAGMSGRAKTIGIVGGMSWASTITYYRVVCEEIIRMTAGQSCGSLRIISFNSNEIEKIIEDRRWQELAEKISNATQCLVEMGSEIIIVASNTAHLAFEQHPASLDKRTIHIADALVDRLTSMGIASVGMVGTSTTSSSIATGRLVRRLGYMPIIPPSDVWRTIDDIIFTRLCRGIIRPEDKELMISILDGIRLRGAARIILGCTELGLLFTSEEKAALGLLDAAEIHASVAASRSLTEFQAIACSSSAQLPLMAP
jgi:aspartate racemase